jgi:FecR protein
MFIGRSGRSFTCWVIVIGMLGISQRAMTAQPSGHILWLRGPVMIIDVSGGQRQANLNDPVEEGESLRTGADGLVQLRFIDGGILSLRTDTLLQIERYSFDAGSREEGAIFMRLIRGGVRSVTGLIAKTNPNAYMLETPTTLLGVRGTDHETYYVPPDLLSATVSPGTYERVHAGATIMQGSTQAIEIEAGQAGFAGIAASRPEQSATLPNIYRAPAEAVAFIPSPETKRMARQRIAAVLAAPPEHTSGVEPWERLPPRAAGATSPNDHALPRNVDAENLEILSLAQPPNLPQWVLIDSPRTELAPARSIEVRRNRKLR